MTGLRLQDRACLIVGGTGGIGRACARRFVDEGARVVVVGLGGPSDRVEAHPLAATVGHIYGDASRPDDVASMFAEATRMLAGRIDVLVHIAGISGRKFGDGPLHECSDDGWDHVIGTNARSTFLTNREAVKLMLGQETDGGDLRGSIVNVGSVLAESPSPHYFATVAYAASKGAVRSLTLASASRYAADRIRFNLIEPGLIDTPMAARAVGDPGIRAYLETKQPMAGGAGAAEDVAEAALYLCEPASWFVTGVVLAVDGGWRLSDGQLPRDAI